MSRHTGPSAPMSATDQTAEAGRGFLIITAAKLWFMVGGALITLGLPRIVGVGGYGQFTVINNDLGLFSMVMVTGVTQAVSRAVSRSPTSSGVVIRQSLGLIGALSAALCVLGLIFAPQIAALRGDESLTFAYRAASVILFAYGLYAVYIGALNGKKDFRVQAKFDIGYTTMKATLVLLGAGLGWGMSGVFGGFAAASVLILVACVVTQREQGAAGERYPGLIALGGGIMASQLVFQFVFRQDVMVLQPVATRVLMDLASAGTPVSPEGVLAVTAEVQRLLGNYGLAATIARLPWQATLAITFVIFPMLSEANFAGDRARAGDYVRTAMRYSLLLIATAALVLCALPDAIVSLIGGADFSRAGIALSWLSVAYVAFALFNVQATMLTASGQALAVLIVTCLTAGVAFLAYLTLLPGATDVSELIRRAGIATLLPFTFGLATTTILLTRRFGFPFLLGTVTRVCGIGGLLVFAGRMAPTVEGLAELLGRPLPKVVGVVYVLVLALTLVVVFLGALFATGEFGPEDKARVLRVLRRKPSAAAGERA